MAKVFEWLCCDCLRVISAEKPPKCECGSAETCNCDMCQQAISDLRSGELGHLLWMNDGISIVSWTAENGANYKKFSENPDLYQ